MRYLLFSIRKNKGTDSCMENAQLISAFDIDGKIPLLPISIICGCTAGFVSNLIRNPQDRFSEAEAKLLVFFLKQ